MVQDAKDWSEIMRIIMIILLYGQPQFLTVKKKKSTVHTVLWGNVSLGNVSQVATSNITLIGRKPDNSRGYTITEINAK